MVPNQDTLEEEEEDDVHWRGSGAKNPPNPADSKNSSISRCNAVAGLLVLGLLVAVVCGGKKKGLRRSYRS